MKFIAFIQLLVWPIIISKLPRVKAGLFGRGLGGIIRRTKSISDLPDALPPSSPKLTKLKKSRPDSTTTLDKSPTEHATGLEANVERRRSWETDDTLVADRRESLDSMGTSRFHDPSRAVDVPPYSFVSERGPPSWRNQPPNWRNIRTIWNNFKIRHPKAAKLTKWTSWLLGAAATTGGSVVLSEEIRKLYRQSDKNLTFNQLDDRVKVITSEFERLLNASEKEFEQRPNPGIFDIYFNPLERVRRGDRSDFLFDFEKLPPLPTSPTKKFFPKRNETYVGKHENKTTSGILYFNDSSTTNATFNNTNPLQTEKPTETSTTVTNLRDKEGTVITYKIFEVSNVLIIVGALTIVSLAFIVMCCFCYGCKSRERRYTNRDTVRARVIARDPNVPRFANPLPSVNLYPYDTPPGVSLNHPNTNERSNIGGNIPHYEMVDVDLDDSTSTGFPNRAYYPSQNQTAILPTSNGPTSLPGRDV